MDMTRELAIKTVLGLITRLLDTYGFIVSQSGNQWQLALGDHTSGYPDQLSAVLAGCEAVIRAGGCRDA